MFVAILVKIDWVVYSLALYKNSTAMHLAKTHFFSTWGLKTDIPTKITK